MKYAGKITLIGLICLILAVSITWTVTQQAKADTILAGSYVLPTTSSLTITATHYVVLWDRATGDLVTAADGTTSSAVTWAAAALDENDITVHGENTMAWVVVLPAMDGDKNYAMAIFNNATPTKGDLPVAGPYLFDREAKLAYSDANPVQGSRVKVINY